MATSARLNVRIEESTDPTPAAQENDMTTRKTTKAAGLTAITAALASMLIAFAPGGAADTTTLADGHSVGAGQNVGTDPLIPFGTEPMSPVRLGYVDSNHDEANTSNGGVDTPF
jgi:hypothetical protein